MVFLMWTILIWNVFVMVLYGIDKQRIEKKSGQINDSLLLLVSFLGASFGAAMGMIFFNHKLDRSIFRMLIPIAAVINVILFMWFY